MIKGLFHEIERKTWEKRTTELFELNQVVGVGPRKFALSRQVERRSDARPYGITEEEAKSLVKGKESSVYRITITRERIK